MCSSDLHDLTLNRALSLADAVVDLAHELVHYNEKGMLDPYKSGFEVSRFIRSGIEGEGGELAALEMECKIAWSFEEKFEGFPEHRLCVRYKRAGHRFAKEVARLDYYAVGAWMENLPPSLREKIPEISERASVFMSSYANKPYPVALAEEYWATRQLACKNNRKKFQLIAAQSATGRSIASLELKEEQRRLQDYEERYCMPTKVEVFDN